MNLRAWIAERAIELAAFAIVIVRQLRSSKRQNPCAWCNPFAGRRGTSHGICRKHQRELMREAREIRRAA